MMPCLNEEATLAACVDEARHWLREVFGGDDGKYEILVADNGSTDRSVSIAESKGARVVRISEKGYGSALGGGIRAAKGRYVIMADSDLSYDFGCLPDIVMKLREGADLVMGNRFAGVIDDGAMPFLHRYLGNPVLSFLGRLFFNLPVGDFHCGMRGFDRESILSLGLRTTGMEFASEMIVRAGLAGKRIEETPARLRRDGRGRRPHLNTWRDGWRHLRFLLLYCPTWLFTVPGITLMLMGLFGGVMVMPGPLKVSSGWGGFTLDVHTLVYCALFFTGGFQLVSTGAFVKAFARSHGLLPSKGKTLFEKFTLEWGLVAGVAMFVLGCAGTVAAWHEWSVGGYSVLDPRGTLRLVVPSATAVTLGMQLSITSFLVGIVGLVKNK